MESTIVFLVLLLVLLVVTQILIIPFLFRLLNLTSHALLVPNMVMI